MRVWLTLAGDAYGLPIGEVRVAVAGQTEAVVIEAGRVTEF